MRALMCWSVVLRAAIRCDVVRELCGFGDSVVVGYWVSSVGFLVPFGLVWVELWGRGSLMGCSFCIWVVEQDVDK